MNFMNDFVERELDSMQNFTHKISVGHLTGKHSPTSGNIEIYECYE